MPQLMSQKQFAEHIGKKPSYVTLLKQMGRLVFDESGKKVLVEESLAMMDETKDPSKQGVVERHEIARNEKEQNKTPGSDNDDLTSTSGKYQHHKALREKYNALQAKIAYEREIGELLPIDEVRAAVMNSDAIIRNRLESLPDILAPKIASEKDEAKIRSLLIDQIEYILTELSNTLKGEL